MLCSLGPERWSFFVATLLSGWPEPEGGESWPQQPRGPRQICPAGCDLLPTPGVLPTPGSDQPSPPAACPAHTYGHNCSQACACFNGASCDPVHGQCHCAPGWMGPSCLQGKPHLGVQGPGSRPERGCWPLAGPTGHLVPGGGRKGLLGLRTMPFTCAPLQAGMVSQAGLAGHPRGSPLQDP